MATARPPQSVTLNLLGQKIVLKSQEDPALVQEVVDLVTIRLKEAQRRIKGHVGPQQVSLLALLDLAEEYVKAKKRASEHRRRIDEKANLIAEKISILSQ